MVWDSYPMHSWDCKIRTTGPSSAERVFGRTGLPLVSVPGDFNRFIPTFRGNFHFEPVEPHM